jgi:tRNA-2-methylthio-N6-dimethylallyladenosine synthase
MKEKRHFFVETFGCQMNVNDSQKVEGLLLSEGHHRAASPEEADFVFINTCAVREKAQEKLFHALGRLKHAQRQRPQLKIGVGGCVAQLEGERVLARAGNVNVLVGTHNVARVPALLEQALEASGPVVDLDRSADSFAVPDAAVAHSSAVRAYVTAMEGCNHVCSFCVVPRTRGTEVCRPAVAIVGEVRSLVARGYPEVMLLGQTVNAYEKDGVDFPALLEAVGAVPGLQRLRFTTSHPGHVDARFARAMRDLPNLCPYLHLPVQSGSDRILESMRRGYTRSQYLETAVLLREHVRSLALTSDIIVGYPGETDADFQATVDLVDEVGFDGLFVFAYSARPGTSALRLADDVPEAEKKRRVRVLNERQQRFQARRHAERVGSIEEVLVENVDEPGRLSGRTRHFQIVHFDGPAEWRGSLRHVEIAGAGANSLTGRVSTRSSH